MLGTCSHCISVVLDKLNQKQLHPLWEKKNNKFFKNRHKNVSVNGKVTNDGPSAQSYKKKKNISIPHDLKSNLSRTELIMKLKIV